MMYFFKNKKVKLFLVHPGGPFFKNKDDGYWSIPKGLADKNEVLIEAAKREFNEETGLPINDRLESLGSIQQKGGKIVHAWAYEIDNDNPVQIFCNTFELEWPPKSGKKINIPEVDKGEFFHSEIAKQKINSAQVELIDRLEKILNLN
ncbi:MAG: NUDIX domain-containing protein [Ignavibacteriaceae bacterium]